MKIGFIDYYLDEWHANNYPQMLRDNSGGEMEVCFAYGQITSPVTGMTSKEWCEKYGICLCESIEEVVEKSDALVVLSPDNCEKHEELAELALRSGKRTYIDKTFAPDRKSAKAMFALGEANGTPCYSTSALRFAQEYQPYMAKKISAVNTWGPNGLETYSIHQLEPIMMLMKGRVCRVLAEVNGEWKNLFFEMQDGRSAAMLCSGSPATPFLTNICTEDGAEMVEVKSDFFASFIQNLVRFFATGEIPVSHEETVSIMEARELAVKAAQTPGVWVCAE